MDDHSSLQVNTNVYEQYSFYLFVIGDDVYVYIVLMLDKAGQQERWGIVKKGGKGRREKETLDRILWVDIIKRNEQTSLYFRGSGLVVRG